MVTHTALPKAGGAVTLLPLPAVDVVPSLTVLGQTGQDKKGGIQIPRHNQCQFRHFVTVNFYQTCYPMWSSHILGTTKWQDMARHKSLPKCQKVNPEDSTD